MKKIRFADSGEDPEYDIGCNYTGEAGKPLNLTIG